MTQLGGSSEPVLQSLIAAEHKYVSYFKAHERLLLILVCLAFLGFGVVKALTFWEHHDQRVYDHDKAMLQADREKSAADAARSAELAAQYKDLAAKVLETNTKLEQAIASRDTELRKQKEIDKTLPPDKLAARWMTLLSLPPLSVVPTTLGQTVTDSAAHVTVDALEDLPVLRQNVVALRTESDGKGAQIGKAEERITGLQNQVDGLNKTVIDQTAACKAEVNLVKAKARKSKLRWAAAGSIATLAVKGLLKILVLH